MCREVLNLFRRASIGLLLILAGAVPASAQHQMCEPAAEDCRQILIDYIRAETVGLDVAFWFMEDPWLASEVINRWKANVPVRILMDTEANSPNPKNALRLAEFEAAGIPMRERVASGILHWKMMLFAGQNLVQFSGANYSPEAFTPSAAPYTNYIDEAILFTTDLSIVNSFKTRFDDLWTNTTSYANYRNITGTLERRYPTYAIDPRLNFVPWESHFWRAREEYRREPSAIDVIMYRITDWRFTDEMIQAKQRGIRVRLITEPQQYRDVRRLWHSYNIDLLYMAGIEIKHRVHLGLNHQKSVILRGISEAILGSSNWSSASADSQEEHNLITTDPYIYQWLVDQFERKWNNTTGVTEYGPFTPLAPDQPTTPTPATGAENVAVEDLVLQWDAGPWAHKYDIYLGKHPAEMELVVADQYLGPSEWTGHYRQFELTAPLTPGTTYYWRVVGKTMANMTAASPLWTFRTAGTAPPLPPVTLVRHPYLQQVTATSAVIVWATRENGPAKVRYSSPGGDVFSTPAVTTHFPASATGLAQDYYQHVARLTGLSAGTTYTYDTYVSDRDMNAQVDTVRTAPPPGTGTVKFVAIGDSGTGSTQQQQIASRMASDTFDLMLHGGDIAYGNTGGTGGATFQTMDDWFFSIYQAMLRTRPVFPSIGNHDSRASNANGQPYLGLFVLPEHGATAAYPDHAERYYSFDYGRMHVVVLDTELAFQDPARRAAQLAWLDADLAATTQPWKVALFHRSPYSSGGEHGSDLVVREAFAPIFESRGVQLVISAHEHDYERTVKLRAGAPAADGVTYVVAGGGGAPLYPAGSETWTAHAASAHHYVRGTVAECTIRIEAVGVDGAVFDSNTIRRCDNQAPTASITSPAGGATVNATISVAVNATDDDAIERVELLVNGTVVGSDTTAPYAVPWNTGTVADGAYTLTAKAYDLTGNSVTSAAVNVTVDNPTPPTISSVANQTIDEDTTTGSLALTVADQDTPVNSLVVSATSSNAALVPNGNIVLGGSGANRTVTVTPAANQAGQTTITLTVSDGGFNVPTTFTVTVAAVNDAPTITGIAGQTTAEDTATSALSFTVGDVETAAGSLVVTAASSNSALVASSGITFGGAGASRTVTLTPVANASGTATITVGVSDGTTETTTNFTLTVTAVNDAPTITSIANQTIAHNGTTGALAFTVGDIDTAIGSLTVTRSSSNTAVVPAANVVLGGSGASRTVTVTPSGQAGVTTIRLTVSDGDQTAFTEFTVTVRPSTLSDSDFNGDGKMDLLWQNIFDGYLATWSLNGTSMLSSDLLSPNRVPDTNWRMVGTGDFNGDGKPDIVWQEQTQGWIGIWLMNGTTLLSSTTLSPRARERVDDINWKIAGVLDINNDGKVDILWQERTQGWLVAWLLNGLTVTSSVSLTPERVSDTNWKIVANGDFNGDGKTDLIWQEMATGYLAAWLMNGLTLVDSVLLSPQYVTDTTWKIVAAGDVDVDGQTDLVWQDQAQGWLAIWLMNGTTLKQSVGFNPERVSDTKWKIVGPK